jgi:hypothetical protein
MPTSLRGLALVGCLIASQVVADTLHVIALRHRPVSEIQPLIQPLLRADEGIGGSGYQLILRATDTRKREIEQLVAKLDVAARQLTVTVRHGAVHDEQRARDAVSGRVDIGNRARVIIPGDNGADPGLIYRGERSTSSSDSTSSQVVRVQDGQRAFIRVGQSAPSVERVLTLTGRRTAVVAQGIRFEEFTTGFDVLPHVRGDTVQLEITPHLTSPRSADGTYRFQELRTTVTARLGEWIDLGLLLGESSDVSRAILNSARSQTNERATISMKVE